MNKSSVKQASLSECKVCLKVLETLKAQGHEVDTDPIIIVRKTAASLAESAIRHLEWKLGRLKHEFDV